MPERDVMAALAALLSPHAVKPSDRFGAIAVAALLAKGATLAAKAASSPAAMAKLQNLKKQLTDKESHLNTQYIRYRNKARRLKDPNKKRAAEARAGRYQEMLELVRARKLFASRGIPDDTPKGRGLVLEYRRNTLSNQWTTASPERKKYIEGVIKGYDAQLSEIAAQVKATQSGSANAFPAAVNRQLASGVGGMQFTVQSPSGPGRLVRLPMFPSQDAQAFSGANGIISPGDDPVLMMQLVSPGVLAPPTGVTNFVQSSEYEVQTRMLEYGQYRVLGIQAIFFDYWLPRCTFAAYAGTLIPVVGVGINIKSLRTYNGAEMLIPLEGMDIEQARLFRNRHTHQGVLAGPQYFGNFPSRYSPEPIRGARFFGLRDNPVIDSNAQVFMTVQCFASRIEAGTTLPVPVSLTLVAEAVTDNVYGDPMVPSAGARPGAQVKLRATQVETGPNEALYRVVNAHWKPQ